MKKILISLLTVALVTAVSVKATGAFFTDTVDVTNNTFTAGTLNVNVLEQNGDTDFVNETLATNWVPGQDTLVNFDIKNTGNVPVQLRGYALGTWNNPSLDSQDKVHVTKVERWNGAAWETLLSASSINGYFYYTTNGTVGGTFFDVAANDRAQLRLTVHLDETAGNDFQGGQFVSSLHVEARQATTPTTVWP